MPRWFHARTVVEEPEVQEAADRFHGEFQRFEEAFEALKWLLARKCDGLESLRRKVHGMEYHLYRQSADLLAGTPEITVLYTFDDDDVLIIDINAEEVEAEID